MILARTDAAGLHLGLADPQGLEGPLDRGLAQAVRVAEPLAETDDAREGVDDPEAVRGRLGDQQAAIVGAEVEGRIGAAPARTAGRSRRIGARHRGRVIGVFPPLGRAGMVAALSSLIG